MELSTLFLLALAVTTVNGDATGWNYDPNSDHGPAHWVDFYPYCGGVMQSPVSIDTKHALYNPELDYFNLTDYSQTDGIQMSLHNMGGHTVEVIYSGQPRLLTGGSLPYDYVLDQFHFHWGKSDDRGSEHALDGHHFPMEMHLVHHQAKMSNSHDAMSLPFGLAVLGFFFRVGNHNPQFDQLTKHFSAIALPGNHTAIPAFPLVSLLPPQARQGRLDYFRYMGSLTTPPCYESVIWSISRHVIEISEQQLDQFRGLYRDDQEHHLVDDYRPLQKLNKRTITTTFETDNNIYNNNKDVDEDNGENAAPSVQPSPKLLFLVVLALVGLAWAKPSWP